MDKIPMTGGGLFDLENELKHRSRSSGPHHQQITDARTHGDLSENAEYMLPRNRSRTMRAASPSSRTSSRAPR